MQPRAAEKFKSDLMDGPGCSDRSDRCSDRCISCSDRSDRTDRESAVILKLAVTTVTTRNAAVTTAVTTVATAKLTNPTILYMGGGCGCGNNFQSWGEGVGTSACWKRGG